jgi:hypothetical protein
MTRLLVLLLVVSAVGAQLGTAIVGLYWTLSDGVGALQGWAVRRGRA